MLNIHDLLYLGSVTIYLDKDNNLKGTALVELEKGYIPIPLSNKELNNIEINENIINKLKEGNKIYIINGTMYLGRQSLKGPYGEEKTFVSEADVESLSFLGMLEELEYKLSRREGKYKELVKIGEYYREIKK